MLCALGSSVIHGCWNAAVRSRDSQFTRAHRPRLRLFRVNVSPEESRLTIMRQPDEHRRPGRAAFTLIELLVVIAISEHTRLSVSVRRTEPGHFC